MSLSIQTNVNSLMAQSNLRVNSAFQSKTIQQLTSGFRINSSGDDAAGLAIANKYRNDISELTQGVANGNDGVAQLQIMDGGISNISQILDRLKTLATQSASASYTGDRTVLNKEFQTDIAEIDRQAQTVGLNPGGTFAKNLAMYIGGGAGTSSAAALSNGVVSVDLSTATVDSQSLGLKGVEVANANAVADLSKTATNVENIVTNVANQASLTNGNSQFTFTGPGFGDASGVTINVNMNGVGDTTTLVAAINTAIQSAGSGTTAAAAAFKLANIKASTTTNANGAEVLAFSSSNGAFEVQAGDRMANALMGNVVGVANAAGKDLTTQVDGNGGGDGAAITTTGADSVTVSGGGLLTAVSYSVQNNDTSALIVSGLNGTAAFKNAGFTAALATDGTSVKVTNKSGLAFNVAVTGGDVAAITTGTGLAASTAATSVATPANSSAAATFVASGSYQLANSTANGAVASNLVFQTFAAGTDTQAITVSANDATGSAHASTVTLSGTNATTTDQAIDVINQQLQNSDDATLKQITAVKVDNGGTEQINFVSTLNNFSVSVGTAPGGTTHGIKVASPTATQTAQGQTLQALEVGSGNAVDISTLTGAMAAVQAISSAVTALGTAQASIGKGQNQLNYAISLAQSQITNFSSAQSQIRDADIAQQAANLTKAQVLQQASIAAMAQANSAPQQLLTLLRG